MNGNPGKGNVECRATTQVAFGGWLRVAFCLRPHVHVSNLLGKNFDDAEHDYVAWPLPSAVRDVRSCSQRALAHGDDLLQGMLSADIVGFHAFDHARFVVLHAGKYFVRKYCFIRLNTGKSGKYG